MCLMYAAFERFAHLPSTCTTSFSSPPLYRLSSLSTLPCKLHQYIAHIQVVHTPSLHSSTTVIMDMAGFLPSDEIELITPSVVTASPSAPAVRYALPTEAPAVSPPPSADALPDRASSGPEASIYDLLPTTIAASSSPQADAADSLQAAAVALQAAAAALQVAAQDAQRAARQSTTHAIPSGAPSPSHATARQDATLEVVPQAQQHAVADAVKLPEAGVGKAKAPVDPEVSKSEPTGATATEENVKYVMSGQPTGWAAMAQVVREFDQEKVDECNKDMDALLVFVSRVLFYAHSHLTVLARYRPACFPRLYPRSSSEHIPTFKSLQQTNRLVSSSRLHLRRRAIRSSRTC